LKPTRTLQIAHAEGPLTDRYQQDALAIFDRDERERFLDGAGQPRDRAQVQWELLYRHEPQLFARLIAGERLHPGILEWLPDHANRALEVGAGTGRLTLDLAPRCDHLTAVEPAGPLREILRERLVAAGHGDVEVLRGFFDSLPLKAGDCDLVVLCSAFAPSAMADPDRCLAAIEARCAPDGLIVSVWPSDVAWWCARGFAYVRFDGPMSVDFGTVDEALDLARIFYPHAADQIAARNSSAVDYEVLHINAPRDLCWKRRG
jgi:SAM-dependent methyltransferase